MSAPGDVPAFYVSPPHPCGYLPGRDAVTLFLDPTTRADVTIYTRLARYGFRRSGAHLYRPRCPGCQACVPVRLPVAAYQPNRSQRRCARGNRDLRLDTAPFRFDAAQFALYRRYMAWRHPGSAMDDADPDHYMACFASDWCASEALTWYDGDNLLAVAILDRLGDALSAVYTFFEPEEAARGLGNLAVLQQVAMAHEAELEWVYLGYWIRDCAKMSYKIGLRPLEWFDEGRWRRLEPGAPAPF
ncbi:MAG: arginyltransferase [Gammaproteobacteria bacterium]|nr:MAG: arginyltransferase [Gammaproteobacteria bacterium]